MPRTKRPRPIIIGWREAVTLPEWGIFHIKTKIDTGARTSAIHVDNIVPVDNDRVAFDVIVRQATEAEPAVGVHIETSVVRISRVRPSTGRRQERLVVKTRMRLGAHEREIELSLVSRHGMLCRMLLGRFAIKGFLVDPSHSHRVGPLPPHHQGGLQL